MNSIREETTRTRFGFVLALCLIFAGAANGADPVARVTYLRGSGSAQLPGEPARALRLELPLYVNDRIVTTADSAVRVLFVDATDAWLGAEAVMVIDRFRQDREAPAFATSIVKGVFRMVTGLIARNQPRAVQVDVSVTATIGVRGTHFGGEVTQDSALVMLLDAETTESRGAIEVSNAFGSVLIDEPGFGTEIRDAFSPPSAPRRMQIRSLENLLRSIQTIQRIQVPRMPR